MLAIAGGKGGCGKTTTTLALAGALAGRGYEPLVVDGDCDMPDVHHRLGLPRTNGVDALASGTSLEDAILRSEELPGVAIVTGGRRDALESALRRATSWDGPVLVDCGAGTGRDAVQPLRHADRVVVVSTDQPQCIEDSALTRTIARRLSTPLAGAVLRTTTPPSGPVSLPPGWTVLGQIPQVEDPLDHPEVERTYVTVSKSIFPAKMGERETYTNTYDVDEYATRKTDNHQRYCRRNI